MQFKRATKSSAWLRMALIGPSGSGKSFSALAIATGLGGPVAVIDTERGSASKYADLYQFDTLELPDFDPRRYVEAIRAAAEAGYKVLVIDSLSHAWIGKGGALEMHDLAVDRQKTKNTFTAWREVTPHHNALVEAILQAPLHVIATMRSKVEYVQEKDERTGKTQVRKVGMAPIQREGLDYEFDVVGDLDYDHTLVVGKTRCSALSGKAIREPGADLAKILRGWLDVGGSEPRNPEDPMAREVKAIHDAIGAPPAPKTNGKHLPATGAELKTRLYAHDEKLAREGVSFPGELVKCILKKAGESDPECDPDMTTWGSRLIALAAQETKAFEARVRAKRIPPPAAPPWPAVGSRPPADGLALARLLDVLDADLDVLRVHQRSALVRHIAKTGQAGGRGDDIAGWGPAFCPGYTDVAGWARDYERGALDAEIDRLLTAGQETWAEVAEYLAMPPQRSEVSAAEQRTAIAAMRQAARAQEVAAAEADRLMEEQAAADAKAKKATGRKKTA